MNIGAARPIFREGDEVAPASGAYPGAPGVFLRLKEDVNRADIRQRDGEIRSHPVIWPAYAAKADRGSRN